MARYCINQNCSDRKNRDSDEHCRCCSYPLLIRGRYYLSKALQISPTDNTEVWELEDWGYYTNPSIEVDEYDRWEEIGKIIKILKRANYDTIDLLRNEYHILADLKRNSPDLRIPRVARHIESSYFVYQDYHCLVMEKIPGISLATWLTEHSQLTDEDIAAQWLRQLTNILARIHHQKIQHLDINPSNILLTPGGQLSLIDFGLASYQGGRSLGEGTCGYAAPELRQGQFVPQSDFYALGVTLVHLLTGRKPDEWFENYQLSRKWRQSIGVSARFARLIEALTKPSWRHRPHKTQVIKQRLDAIQFPWKSRVRQFAPAICIGLVITGIVVAIRETGVLQPWEQHTFDGLMQLRPPEGLDDQLLIITVTREHNNSREAPSLSDRTLTALFKQLRQYEPVTIGLDIYRDFEADEAYPELKTELAQEHLFGVCNLTAPDSGDHQGIAPPPEIPQRNLGFADAIQDEDGTLRRHLLLINDWQDPQNPCPTYIDFSFLVALHYLATAHNVEWEDTAPTHSLILGKTLLDRLSAKTDGPLDLDRRSGHYAKTDLRGHQILLNYRASSDLRHIAETLTVEEVLQQKGIPDRLKSRIILIGVVGSRASLEDYWRTPYNTDPQDTIPGVFIQAHKVSQIVNAALGQRSLLQPIPLWGEILWLGLWSSGVGIVASYLARSPRWSVSLSVVIVLALGLACYGLILMGRLVPLVPALIGVGLTLFITGGAALFFNFQSHD